MTKYLLIVLAVMGAVLSFTGWQLWESWQREARVRGEFAAFSATVEREGEEATVRAKAENRKRKETNDATRSELIYLRAIAVELRDRPSVRPDGSPLPTTAACPEGTDRPAGEFVPLADYRALEDRARQDAARLMAWEKWRTDNNIPVAGDEHEVQRWAFMNRVEGD